MSCTADFAAGFAALGGLAFTFALDFATGKLYPRRCSISSTVVRMQVKMGVSFSV